MRWFFFKKGFVWTFCHGLCLYCSLSWVINSFNTHFCSLGYWLSNDLLHGSFCCIPFNTTVHCLALQWFSYGITSSSFPNRGCCPCSYTTQSSIYDCFTDEVSSIKVIKSSTICLELFIVSMVNTFLGALSCNTSKTSTSCCTWWTTDQRTPYCTSCH